MSELRQGRDNETLSEGIQQYLDPEQADASTFRKFLANLAGNVGEYIGADKTLPEILDEIKQRQSMNERYSEEVMPTNRDEYPSIPADSMPIFEKQSMMSMIPVGAAKGMNLEAKYPKAFNEPLRKKYLQETRYQRGLMGDIGESPRYNYDSPEQIYSTTQVADDPFYDVAKKTPESMDKYKHISDIREYGKKAIGGDVGNKYPELRDKLRAGEEPMMVTTRATKELPIAVDDFNAMEDNPFSFAIDESKFNNPEVINSAKLTYDYFINNPPKTREEVKYMLRAQQVLLNATEKNQHARMIAQNRNYLSFPVPKSSIRE